VHAPKPATDQAAFRPGARPPMRASGEGPIEIAPSDGAARSQPSPRTSDVQNFDRDDRSSAVAPPNRTANRRADAGRMRGWRRRNRTLRAALSGWGRRRHFGLAAEVGGTVASHREGGAGELKSGTPSCSPWRPAAVRPAGPLTLAISCARCSRRWRFATSRLERCVAGSPGARGPGKLAPSPLRKRPCRDHEAQSAASPPGSSDAANSKACVRIRCADVNGGRRCGRQPGPKREWSDLHEAMCPARPADRVSTYRSSYGDESICSPRARESFPSAAAGIAERNEA